MQDLFKVIKSTIHDSEIGKYGKVVRLYYLGEKAPCCWVSKGCLFLFTKNVFVRQISVNKIHLIDY